MATQSEGRLPVAGAMMAAVASRAGDRALWLLMAATIIGAAGFFWPSISALAELWSHPERRTYQHGYLIAGIVLWLLFRERRRLAEVAGRPIPALTGAAVIASVLWAIAWNANLQVVHFVLWPVALWCALAGWLGRAAGRILLLPLAILYFAIPVWDALTPALQSATVLANRLLAMLIGMPVLIEGNLIHIPEGSFEIAGGCSGLNYLVVGLAVPALLGELNQDSMDRRILLIVMGGVLALVSNWLRVFIIILAGHVTDMEHYLVTVDHYNFGWVLFGLMLFAFFLFVRRLPPTEGRGSDAGARRPGHGRAAPAILGFAALALGPALTGGGALLAAAASTESVGIRDLDLPGVLDWEGGPAVGTWVPRYPGADAETLVEFAKGDQRVAVYTATYLRQTQGRELIGHDSSLMGHDRGRLSSGGGRIAFAGSDIRVAEANWKSSGGAQAVLWWTYQIGARRIHRDLAAQLWYGVASLWSRPVSAIVALRADCNPDCARARRVLEDFSRDALPDLLAGASRTGE